jgi:hypothetical protein
MKKARIAAAVGVLFVLALTGCTGAPTAAHSPTPKATPTKDGDGTIAQWASVVAEQKAYLADWKAKWDADQCSVNPSFTCKLETITGATVAKTVNISLQIPESKTATTGYIGTPPSEIRALYDATQQLAQTADDAGAAWQTSCGLDAGPDCDGLLFKFSSAAESLTSKFEAWTPYL